MTITERIIEKSDEEWKRDDVNDHDHDFAYHAALAAAREALLIAKEEIHRVGYRPPVFEVTSQERQAFLQAIDWTCHALDRFVTELSDGNQASSSAAVDSDTPVVPAPQLTHAELIAKMLKEGHSPQFVYGYESALRDVVTYSKPIPDMAGTEPRTREQLQRRLREVSHMTQTEGTAAEMREINAVLAGTEPRLRLTLDEALQIGREAIMQSTLPAVSLWQSAADVVTRAVYDALSGQCQEAFGMGGQSYRCVLLEGHEGGHAHNNMIMWSTPQVRCAEGVTERSEPAGSRPSEKAERAALVAELVNLSKWIAANVDLKPGDNIVADPVALTGRTISAHILERIHALMNDEAKESK